MQYFFILGRQPELSKAEIQAKFKKLRISSQEIVSHETFQILDLSVEIDPNQLIEELGGTIKIGKIISELKNINVEALLPLIPPSAGKINFGISTYNCSVNINSIGKNIKSKLKEDNLKARFVSSKENPLSSVIVKKNHLLDKGIEFVIMRSENTYSIGQTIAVQPFEKLSNYDYGRPARDDKSGMIPPKLAQIMINLAEKSTNSTLYDPFCGSGTILQQALLLGFKKVVGSDSSEKAIQDSKTNLIWLAKTLNKSFNYKLFTSKSVNINEKIEPGSIDLIVTEPFMGPALRGKESPEALRHTIKTLAKLYKDSLAAFAKTLKKEGVVLMIIPTIKTRTNDYKIEMNRILPKSLKIDKSWEYSRPGQHITRKIYKMIKE